MTIKQKQHLLAYLGLYEGEIDGKWGPLSEEATRRFQEATSLDADGIFGKQTTAKIQELIGSGVTALEAPEEADEDFWDDIEYFDKSEFICPCGRCGGFPVQPKEKLVRLCDEVRRELGVMKISSGVRCQEHNDELPNSAPNSRHLGGRAVDFRIIGKTAAQTLAHVQKKPHVRYAYIIDANHVHMDIE